MTDRNAGARLLGVLAVAVGSLVMLSGSASQASALRDTAREGVIPDFTHQTFDRSTTIDNKWLPLTPGTQLESWGATSEGKKRIPHRIVSTVTDLTKEIGGVRTLAVWERDYSAGELVEAELAFYAQDNAGNVWHLGEYPEEYEDGKFVRAPAWIDGVKGARAGLLMPANPRTGTPSFPEGFAPPPVNWTDRAQVRRLGFRLCVPYNCFDNVLLMAEYNQNELGQEQLKYYAPGVGNVLVGWTSVKDTDQETLALVKYKRLAAAGMANARREALKLEQHAYIVSKAVYGRTPPLRRLGRERHG